MKITIFLISMSWVIYLFADKLANWHNGTLKLQKHLGLKQRIFLAFCKIWIP